MGLGCLGRVSQKTMAAISQHTVELSAPESCRDNTSTPHNIRCRLPVQNSFQLCAGDLTLFRVVKIFQGISKCYLSQYYNKIFLTCKLNCCFSDDPAGPILTQIYQPQPVDSNPGPEYDNRPNNIQPIRQKEPL